MLTHRFDTIIGDIPSDWGKGLLRDVLANQMSGDWGDDEGDAALNVLRSTNFTNNGMLDFSDVAVRHFSVEKAEQFDVRKKDLLVERSGGSPTQPIGRVGFVRESLPGYGFSNFVQLLRPDSQEIDSDYLGWVLHELQRSGVIERLQQQSTQMRNLNYRDYLRIYIPKPSLKEQRAIALVLQRVEGAIEETKAEFEAARRLKKALMQQLFTRGMPGRHKKFRPVKVFKYWHLEVPSGWERTTFHSVIDGTVNNGYSPVCPQDPTGGWLLSLDALGKDGFNSSGKKPAPIEDAKLNDFLLRKGDILVSRSNTPELVGRAGMYQGEPENCYYPDLMMRFRVKEERIAKEFADSYLRSSLARRWFRARASGTSGSMVKIKRRDLLATPLILPTLPEQEEMIQILSDTDKSIEAIGQQLIAQVKLKTSLLQNLLTGKVRIKMES